MVAKTVRAWWQRLAHSTKARQTATKFLPGLEALEDRTVPAFVPGPGISTGFGAEGFGVGDVNNDGQPDVVVPNKFNNRLAVYLNDGNGNFDDANPISYVTLNLPAQCVLADFNGDGNLDIVVSNHSSDALSVFVGDGRAGFGRLDFNLGATSYGVTVGDFNGDGKLDIAATDDAPSGKVYVLLNTGNNPAGNPTFAPPTFSSVGKNPRALTAADFNGDGKLDLVVANTGSDNASILLNKGNGTFNPSITLPSEGIYVYAVAAGDFNGDGKADVAVTYNASGKDANGDPIPSERFFVYLSNGNGTFSSPLTVPSGGKVPAAVVAADFNGDGRTDLGVANAYSDRVAWLAGNGAGGFTLRGTAPTGSLPVFMVEGDFNRDGRPDLFVLSGQGKSVSVLLNQPDPPEPLAPPVGALPASGSVSSFSISKGKPRRSGRTGRYRQVLTLRYQGNQILQGPVAVVLEQLDRRAKLRRAVGRTAQGDPTLVVTPPGGTLNPGESVAVVLEFSAPSSKIRFTPQVLAG